MCIRDSLNRVDDIVIFNGLDKKHIRKIVDIELDKVIIRIQKLSYNVTITDAAKDFLVEKGFYNKYGARPLNRAIQKYIEDLVAENVVDNILKEGDSLLIDKSDDDSKLSLSVDQKQPAAK